MRGHRPNLLASLLAAALVVTILLPLLGIQSWLPTLGMARTSAASSAGTAHALPVAPGGCREESRLLFGGYRFSATCAGQAPSFDGRLHVVRNAGVLAGVGLVESSSGASLDDLGMLDGMAFALFWSPNAHRFFANQQRDGLPERMRLFEVRGGNAAERPALPEAAAAVLRARRPCFAAGDIGVSGVRWGADGRRIAMLVTSRRQACGGTGGWRPLWMIGDAVTGTINRASIQTRPARHAPLPTDGPYATL